MRRLCLLLLLSLSVLGGIARAGDFGIPGQRIRDGLPVRSIAGGAAVTNKFVTSISPTGVVTLAQPAFSNLSGSATTGQLPIGTSGATIGLLNGINTWSALQTFGNSDIALTGSSTGVTTFTSANAGGSNFTITVPAATDTLSLLGTAQTFTAVKTFTNSDFSLLGSSTGATTFTSANAGASNFTLTIPGATDTMALLATAQTLTNKTISGASNTLSAIATGSLATVQGNGTKVQLSTGTTTTNDCVKYDVNGNAVDAGSACASGASAFSTAMIASTAMTNFGGL